MNVSKQSKQIVQTLMFVSSVMFFVVTTNVGSASAHEQYSHEGQETYQKNGWKDDSGYSYHDDREGYDSNWDDERTDENEYQHKNSDDRWSEDSNEYDKSKRDDKKNDESSKWDVKTDKKALSGKKDQGAYHTTSNDNTSERTKLEYANDKQDKLHDGKTESEQKYKHTYGDTKDVKDQYHSDDTWKDEHSEDKNKHHENYSDRESENSYRDENKDEKSKKSSYDSSKKNDSNYTEAKKSNWHPSYDQESTHDWKSDKTNDKKYYKQDVKNIYKADASKTYEYHDKDAKDHSQGKHGTSTRGTEKSEKYNVRSYDKRDKESTHYDKSNGNNKPYHYSKYSKTSHTYDNDKKWDEYGSRYGRLSSWHDPKEKDGWMNEYDKAEHLSLRSALQEHAAVAMPAFRAELEQSDDREAAMAAVDKNSEMVADSVEMMYADTKDEFSDLWQTHIDAYLMAVNAERDSDEFAKQEAEEKLAMFASEASDWFVSQNSDYDANTLHEMFATHGAQTMSLIEQLAAKDYDAAYKSAHEAYGHMGMLADYLATMHSKEYDHPSSNGTVDDHEVDHRNNMMSY